MQENTKTTYGREILPGPLIRIRQRLFPLHIRSEPNCPNRHISALEMQCGTVAVPGVSRGACFLDGKNPKTRVGEFKHKEGAGGNWEIWGGNGFYIHLVRCVRDIL